MKCDALKKEARIRFRALSLLRWLPQIVSYLSKVSHMRVEQGIEQGADIQQRDNSIELHFLCVCGSPFFRSAFMARQCFIILQ